jgi:hypothetical protein
MNQGFAIKIGDTLPALEGICTGGDGLPVDLTSATVRVGIRRQRHTNVLHTGTAVIVGDPTEGRVRFAWPEGLTTTFGVGDYEYEFEVKRGADVATFPGDGMARFRIVRDIVPAAS